MPPKNVLLDKVYDLESDPVKDNIAFFGIHLCDVSGVRILDKIFAEDPFYKSKRNNSLIVATSCQPTNNCFCHVFGANKHQGFDLFVQEEYNGNFTVYAKSETGVSLLEKIKGRLLMSAPYLPVGHDQTQIDLFDLNKAVENRQLFEEHWQGIANNCFGCGACTAVCPLCFCFDAIDRTDPQSGNCHRSRRDDACFFANFSKISNFDFRPENVDRLYNWYHHKFVRGPEENEKFLCVGCGRCITACPANLNIIRILSAIDNVFDKATP